MPYEPVIGLEVHIEMQTRSKMFCACPVVDSVSAPPNSAVCPVCAGHPGTLPVVNQAAVEYALRVALALGCRVNPVSIFARKNYFYPDIPKGYQISQYEQPLAEQGQILLQTSQGERLIRIRRAHLEEDTGKLTHLTAEPCSLVDLNRAGVPLLEVVTEPDFHSAEEVRLYAEALRALVRTLGVNSGDLEKGVMRIEPNISIRPAGTETLGTKVEIKNLNSFRALERGVTYEIARQTSLLEAGGKVLQETVGWDEAAQATFSQRSKEDAHDYRYLPEPDLPPLRVEDAWVEAVRARLPEMPWARRARLEAEFGLSRAEAWQLVENDEAGRYFESVMAAGGGSAARTAFAWVTGELSARMNAAKVGFASLSIQPRQLADLLARMASGEVNQHSAKKALDGMFATGQEAGTVIAALGLAQVSDEGLITRLVEETLADFPAEAANWRAGKPGVENWLFGQVMRKAGGKANPQNLRAALEKAR
jgi:aspartyl-tRNA(Asn)/glutamyl-tRNA(Gln) amidotransferase subunit B